MTAVRRAAVTAQYVRAKLSMIVIPAQAGIQYVLDVVKLLDPRFRGGDVGWLWLPGVPKKQGLPVSFRSHLADAGGV